jgi:hypothetical protein
LALEKQVVSVSFGQGVDLLTDEKQVPAGKMLVLENAQLSETLKTIRKRNGFRSIPGIGATIPEGRALATRGEELFIASGGRGYALSSLGYVDKGLCEALQITTKPVIRSTYEQTAPDCAIHASGISVFAWEDSSGGARYSVHDTATGQPIVSNALLSATGAKPKPIALGNYVAVVYFETATNHVAYVAIPVATPTSPGAPVDIATNADAAGVYDATSIAGRLFVAYLNNGASNRISLRSLTPTLTLSAEATIATGDGPACLTVFGDESSNAWVAYGVVSDLPLDLAVIRQSTVMVAAMSHDLASTPLALAVADTIQGTARNIAGIASGTTATVYYELGADEAHNAQIRSVNVTLAGVASGAGVLARSVGLASKPWIVNDEVHVLAAHDSPLQPTYFVLAGASVVGKIAPGDGGGLTVKPILPEVVLSGGTYSLAYLKAHRLDPSGGNILAQTGVMLASLDFAALPLTLEMSENLHVTGGVLWMFDGARVVEHGFHLFPENLAAAASETGGAVDAGQHQYVAVYEWTDNAGLVHRSAPSVPVTVTTTGSTASVALTIPTLRLTAKSSPVSIAVYGTQADQAIFYRLTSLSSPLVNDSTADSVTFTVTQADSVIAGNEQLYTTGGEVENIAPPAPLVLASYRNRAVLVPSENPLSWWFSKKLVPGAPVEFSDSFVQAMDQRGGGITAAASMDEKLILFKRSQLFVVVGDGPSANGLQNDYSDPHQIPSDVGCISPRSLVLTPDGLMFQSEKGIYLLDRSLAVQYVGDDVDAYRSSLVTAARLLSDTHEVRFTLDNGIALVWNYLARQWSVSPSIDAADATIFQGRFTYLRPSGLVLQETPGTYTDDGSLVRVKAKTAWFSFAGLQGFQRVYRLLLLGEYKGPHKITISIAYDFNPEPAQVVTVDAEDLLGTPLYGADEAFGSGSPFGGEHPTYCFRLHLARQKCSAVQVMIEESQSPPYGEGLGLSALAFEVGGKKGGWKRSAQRTVR